MRTNFEKWKVLDLKTQGHGYKKISKLTGLTRDVVRGICVNKKIMKPHKRGPKFLLTKSDKLKIKRDIARLNDLQEKANCRKIIDNCNLRVSQKTLQRHLTAIDVTYKKSTSIIQLSKNDRKCRVDTISQWMGNNHVWENTVFTDEKWFSFDGPSDWRSYSPKSRPLFRGRRQAGGGGIMVWALVMPNGLLTYRIISGTYKAQDYVNLLTRHAVPIAALNLGLSFCLQQDNAPIHRAKLTKEFLKNNSIAALNWPPRSPDLNIMENVWKMLSDIVYDGKQPKNKQQLTDLITQAFLEINMNRRQAIINLYGSFRRRLCDVLKNNGKLCNY